MAHASNAVARAVSVARHQAASDAGGESAVCLLACVGEDSTLAVSWRIDVIMARFWVALGDHLDGVLGVDDLRWWWWCLGGEMYGKG